MRKFALMAAILAAFCFTACDDDNSEMDQLAKDVCSFLTECEGKDASMCKDFVFNKEFDVCASEIKTYANCIMNQSCEEWNGIEDAIEGCVLSNCNDYDDENELAECSQECAVSVNSCGDAMSGLSDCAAKNHLNLDGMF